MALTAAAGLVGANTAVRAGFAIVRAGARALARFASHQVARAGRAAARFLRPCNSFAPDTPVVMADGSTLSIDQVQEGDQVAATDPVTGQTIAEPVIDIIVGYGDKHLIQLWVDCADTPLTATAGHPIWIDGRGWTNAQDVGIGDRVLTPGGATASIRQVRDLGTVHDQLVYNLNIATIHTYTVVDDDTPLIVHNWTLPHFARGAPRSRGVYAIHYSDSSVYVGRSVNIHRRLHQHMNYSGRLNGAVSVRYYSGGNRGYLRMRKLEQGIQNRYIQANVRVRGNRGFRRYAHY